MIKLIKGAVPAVLRDNAAAWTAAIIKKISISLDAAKAERNKYNHPDIKAALKAEVNGKCAYCESKFGHVTYGDIEHILPKAVHPSLWFDWDNLTIACDVCNTNKANHEGFIDPYVDDPERELVFVGEIVWPMPGNENADFTVRQLKLNRDDLIGRRRERIEYLMRFADSIMKTNDLRLRGALREDFQQELVDVKEYCALSRTIARELRSRGVL